MAVQNEGARVERSVSSILAQSHHHLELVVVDDGSTDDTWQRLRGFADPRVVALRQEARGLPAALNAGLRLCRGQFIARMDGDDRAHPERLATQLLALMQRPDVGYLGTGMRLFTPGGKLIGARRLPLTVEETTAALEAGSNPFFHPTLLFRRQVLESVGGYREGFRKAEDLDLHLRLRAHTAGCNLPDCLLDYEVRPASNQYRDDRPFALYALVLHELERRGDGASAGDWQSGVWPALCEWHLHTRLPAMHQAALLRRQASLACAERRWLQALRAALASLRLDAGPLKRRMRCASRFEGAWKMAATEFLQTWQPPGAEQKPASKVVAQ
jgi:glycosyltransferase involved in cell wall biosynthesis